MRARTVTRTGSFGRACLLGLLGVAWPGAATARPAPPEADAEADPPGVIRLEVVRAGGAEPCPGADYFDNRITAMRGGEELFSPAGRLLLLFTMAPAGGGYRGRAELSTPDGERLYDRETRVVEDCTMLAAGLAVGFAQSWKELAGKARAHRPGKTPAEPPPPPVRAAPPPPSPASLQVIRSPAPTIPPVRLPVCKLWLGGYCLLVDIYSFGLSAGALMTLGFTADVGPGAYVGAELRPSEHFSFELQLRGIFPARVVASEPIDPTQPYEPGKEPSFGGVAMLLVPCFRYSWFMGCVVGQFGFNVSQSPVDHALGPSLGVGPRLGVDIPFLERFAVRAWGDVMFEAPSTYALDDVNLKWTQSPVVGMLGAGVAVSFK
jgi:hypothetical protein